jgi:2,4-dienoyl-CoA reductase-like NADH-dependent reductase (Old Yellow Enzyme family)
MTGVSAPASLGPVRSRNRIIKAATFEGRTPDGAAVAAQIGHADAAPTAVESGFDAVEIHCGHSYLGSAFLSPASPSGTTATAAAPRTAPASPWT